MRQTIYNQLFFHVVFVCLILVISACTATKPLSVKDVVSVTSTVITSATSKVEATQPPISLVTPSPIATPSRNEGLINIEDIGRLAEASNPYQLQSQVGQILFRGDRILVAESISKESISITDFRTHEIVATLSDPGGNAELLVASPDSQYLAAISPSTNQVSIWNTTTFAFVMSMPFKGYYSIYQGFVTSLAGNFSYDNRYLAVSGCRSVDKNSPAVCQISDVIIYDTHTGKVFQKLVGYQRDTTEIAFSPDNRQLIIAGIGEPILHADLFVWGIPEEKINKILSQDGTYFYDAGFNSTGTLLVATAGHKGIFVSDLHNWQSQYFKVSGLASKMLFVYEAPLILITGDSTITAWNTSTNQPIRTISTEIGVITRIVQGPSGYGLFTFSALGQINEWIVR